MVVSDNGTELTSNTMLTWQQDRQFEQHYIAPGKPLLGVCLQTPARQRIQNSFVENFNGRLRDECLNEHLFASHAHAPTGDHKLEERLQQSPPPHKPRRVHTRRVCQPGPERTTTDLPPVFRSVLTWNFSILIPLTGEGEFHECKAPDRMRLC